MKKYNSQKLPNALIIEGGTKEQRLKTSLDEVIKLFCTTGAGCGTCSQCVKINVGSHPDFFIYKDEVLKVDTAREIVKHAYTKPSESEQKLFIIENGDTIRQEAQNALLKVIEEPQNAYFIFLCQNSKNLLSTIRSRCQIFMLSAMDELSENETLVKLARSFREALVSELAMWQDRKSVV